MDAARRNCFQSCPWTWTGVPDASYSPAPRTAPASRCHRIVGRANGDRPPHAPVRVREGTPARPFPDRSPGRRHHPRTTREGRRRTRLTSAAVWCPGVIRNPSAAARVLASGTAVRPEHRGQRRSDVGRVRDADGVARLLQLLAKRRTAEHGRSFPGTGASQKHGARIHRGAGTTVPCSPPPSMAPTAGEDARRCTWSTVGSPLPWPA